MSQRDLENSKVTQDFDKAFKFIEQKAHTDNKEDDDIDANMKQLSLKLMTRQRQQVQRAWLLEKQEGTTNQDLDQVM